MTIRPYLLLMRPKQWIKNVFVFAPLIFSRELFTDAFLNALMAFAAFSLTASAVYIVNDIADAEADRLHPEKRYRPLAAKTIRDGRWKLLAGAWFYWVIGHFFTRRPRLLSVGRVVYQKGYDVAIDALSGLADLPWEWRIVGDGPYLQPLKRMVRESGLDGRVQFLGWQMPDEVKGEYARANLFLHPSRHEGMPNAVLEAMASELPVIATRIAGNEELVVHDETGLLATVEDAQSLRVSLKVLLTDRERRETMGHAARRRVEQSFGWNRVADQYQAILARAV